MGFEIKNIKEQMPNGTTHFRFPRASLVNYYMHKKHVNIVLWWNPKGWWEKTELSIGTLADLGAMPIDYEPIDWNKYLELV